MTNKEVMQMALDVLEADKDHASYESGVCSTIEVLRAALAQPEMDAVLAEREECAKVCDDIDTEYEGEDVLATWCAAAIRARGQ